ncbi:amino acid adenylation domain-containing protein [Amycolatopsis acidicola]|uniref:Amino acid adenylation domain-containing protein n=1 Tax=Amycolatopsis acidicola TaxID=2596893 RepID=A0A5N0V5H8_9PSEU|nr:non-ribosomal peptide synthetase [Amycolatopsis acidicola]KAA9159608.1 amino acid adenylation domain-containing protein [Amycolatopsis acidicola]
MESSGAERLPLSHGQQQLWFLDQLAPGEPTYNVPIVHRLLGALDREIMGEALAAVVARHDSLRATFGSDDGTPYQVIAPAELAVRLRYQDFTGASENEVGAALLEEIGTPFDLAEGPMYRFTLFRLGEREHVLCLTIHHIVTDGWSASILHRDLADAYRALYEGERPEFPELPTGYGDYVAWQHEQLGTGVIAEQLEYWAEQLAGLPVLDLPADRPRPAGLSSAGATLRAPLPPELLRRAREFAASQGVSLFVPLVAAVNVVLSRYTGQDDVPLGVPMPGRTEPELEDLVGFFTNMVVLRTDLSGDPAAYELLARISEANLDAFDNQDAPFEKVVDRLRPVRDPSRNPLFGVCVQLLGARTTAGGLAFPGIETAPIDAQWAQSRFDLALTFVEAGDELTLGIEYSTELFDEWRIQALAGHVERVLSAMCGDPSLRISQLPLVSRAERRQLLEYGQGVRSGAPADPVHEVIARTAAADPDAIAAVCRGKELSYGELDRRAGILANYLRAHGIGPERIVAVAMERELDTLVALLGVLKAGAAFVVLDPAHPAARQEFMLTDTGAPLVLTQAAVAGKLPDRAPAMICLDTQWDEIEAAPSIVESAPATRDSLAYVLYTSGSTGKPKGVLIEHRALTSFIESYRRTFSLGPDDRMLQLAALAFDMSQGEIFTGLTVGATLVLVPPETGGSADALAELMRAEQVSYVCFSPAMLSLLDAEPYPALRKIMAGGEAVPGELVNKWNTGERRLVNVYGPTEAAVGCTAYECPHRDWRGAPPIGKPYPDRRMYVVDRWNNLVPPGVPGELLIGGAEGLARGYLNRPELTAEKFVRDPFRPTGRVYRSGDLVRWNADGDLEFFGRLDTQVQLHGLRIELEEIESALLSHPDVAAAAVALRPDPAGDNRLVGYVVPAAEREAPTPADLRRHVGDQLPGYMVPSSWLVLDKFPLTTARKVDRAALPDPAAGPERAREVAEWIEPRTPTEATVAEVFAEVLSLARVGAGDDFFELGGSSLQAMRLASRLSRAFGVKVNVKQLYGSSMVSAVAGTVDALRATGAAADRDPLVVLKADGEQPPLFCLPPVSGSAYAYSGLAGLLDAHPVFSLEAPGFDNDRTPLGTVEELAAEYVDALRETRPAGAYRLLGWSMGGTVAFDMALRLQDAGVEVPLLVIVDSQLRQKGGVLPEHLLLRQFAAEMAGTPGGVVPALEKLLASVADQDVDAEAALTELAGTGALAPEMDAEFLRRRYAVFRANVDALAAYRPRGTFHGNLVLIRATASPDTFMRWGRHADEFQEYTVDGDHFSIWSGAGLHAIAATVRAELEAGG